MYSFCWFMSSRESWLMRINLASPIFSNLCCWGDDRLSKDALHAEKGFYSELNFLSETPQPCLPFWTSSLIFGASFLRLWESTEDLSVYPCFCHCWSSLALVSVNKTLPCFEAVILKSLDWCLPRLRWGYEDVFWRGRPETIKGITRGEEEVLREASGGKKKAENNRTHVT